MADRFDYKCAFCGAPSQKHPADQDMPPSYCHPEDHIDSSLEDSELVPCPLNRAGANLAYQVEDFSERIDSYWRSPNFKIVYFEEPMFLVYWPNVWEFLGDCAAVVSIFIGAASLLFLGWSLR